MHLRHPSDRSLSPHAAALSQRLGPFDASSATHPLVTPLGTTRDGQRLGLLWWPTPDAGAAAPVVAGCGPRLQWWAPSATHAVHRWCAEQDVAGALTPQDHEVAALVGYAPGAAASIGLSHYLAVHRLESWSASLDRALRHLQRGDVLAARVCGDRDAARAPEWAAALRTRWIVAVRLGDVEAAREAATAMMGLPLWTFEHAWTEVARWAGWRDPIDAAPYRRLALDPTRPPADRAAWMLDLAAAEGTLDPALRSSLAELYRGAGLQAFAEYVAGTAGDVVSS